MGTKRIFNTKEGQVCEEYIVLNCPECGQPTEQVNTTLDFTYYGHWNSFERRLQWCVVQRGKEHIDDALLFVQFEQGNNNRLKIASTERLW
jgi:hypothetical protein